MDLQKDWTETTENLRGIDAGESARAANAARS